MAVYPAKNLVSTLNKLSHCVLCARQTSSAVSRIDGRKRLSSDTNTNDSTINDAQLLTTTEKMNDKMELKTLQNASPSTKRPLVLMFGWLSAKPKYLQKYANLYHRKGCDVLMIHTKLMDALWPATCQHTAETTLKLLSGPALCQKPIIVHGFSVGGYLYGEMLVKMHKDKDQWGDVSRRMAGQVMDSPLDFDNMPTGISLAVGVTSRLVQKVLKTTTAWYMKLMYNKVTIDYIRSSDAFKANELRLPTLFLYSKSDPIGLYSRMDEIVKGWHAKGITVFNQCWENSPHVGHFHRYPDEYVGAMMTFMKAIDLPRSDADGQTYSRQSSNSSTFNPIPRENIRDTATRLDMKS